MTIYSLRKNSLTSPLTQIDKVYNQVYRQGVVSQLVDLVWNRSIVAIFSSKQRELNQARDHIIKNPEVVVPHLLLGHLSTNLSYQMENAPTSSFEIISKGLDKADQDKLQIRILQHRHPNHANLEAGEEKKEVVEEQQRVLAN